MQMQRNSYAPSRDQGALFSYEVNNYNNLTAKTHSIKP